MLSLFFLLKMTSSIFFSISSDGSTSYLVTISLAFVSISLADKFSELAINPSNSCSKLAKGLVSSSVSRFGSILIGGTSTASSTSCLIHSLRVKFKSNSFSSSRRCSINENVGFFLTNILCVLVKSFDNFVLSKAVLCS